ncbi:hypothetical protein TIFTF001_018686 [Ficus carica]|uniref:thiamine phosphate synthase n=1 Tax=Ficus carica TaxID=3494 RepID=A0AA88AS63_FICCA|nr:hypothetical protein TIFTF001_018686 [Ficus carica]
MLPSVGIVKVLRQSLAEFPIRGLVVDPVMVSTSGDVLAGPSILTVFRYARFFCSNVPRQLMFNAQLFKNPPPERMSVASQNINVLVKGGDLPDSSDAIDIFFDGDTILELRSSRIKTRNTHGTGCTLASCIAAELAKGSSMLQAVKVHASKRLAANAMPRSQKQNTEAAKCFIESALDFSRDIVIGNGPQGPFDPLLRLKRNARNSSGTHGFDPSDLFLYAVTDSRMNKRWGRSITEAVKAAIEGGATIIQLREKNIETLNFLEAAKSCLEICRSHGVPLLINDRIDVALACDADGVHVGQSDMPAHVVRSLLGPEKIIGVSCKTPEQAEQAWIDGANYLGCGGVFPTNTKANNLTIGLDGLKAVCLASKLPVVAIGGIDATNAGSVLEINAPKLKGVAVVSTLFDRECVLTETRNLHSVLMEATSRVR